ncbi:hypothetical protein HYV64_02145 [Candidatus Shapirobacteria bacterium]|nr:hypothetical protein [Candidatus Shapirobacteria bacterium]
MSKTPKNGEKAFLIPKTLVVDGSGNSQLEADLLATSEEMGEVALEEMRKMGMKIADAPASRKSFSMSSIREEDWNRIFKGGKSQN